MQQSVVLRLLVALAILLVAADPAIAQGGGNGRGRGNRPVPAPTTSASESADAPIQPFRSFGAWLDNADVLPPGEAWLSVYTVYWRSPGIREFDAPVLDAVVGVAPRVQVGASVPYYNLRDGGGFSASGFGDAYVHTKVQLVEPGGRGVGVAVIPTLEILSHPAPELGLDRLNWVLPVAVHVDRDGARFYGTGGYFSRGAVFGGGGIEVPIHPRAAIVGALTHSVSTKHNPLSDAMGLARHRTDASGGVYFVPAPGLVLFTSVGRTIAGMGQDGASFTLTMGVSLGVAGGTKNLKPALKRHQNGCA